MKKKIISLIIGVVLFCSVFAGCALIEHNDEKDAQQVIVTIKDIRDEKNGITYSSGERYIYKSDLISQLNSQGSNYIQNQNYTLQQTVETLLNQLITRELLLIEAERLKTLGDIEWTQKDENEKRENVYSAIDSLLDSFRSEILGEFGESVSDSASDEDSDTSSSTTYPTPDAETTDDDYKYYEIKDGKIQYEKDENGNTVYDKDGNPVPKYIVWSPAKSSYPCLWGTEKEKSLDREAMERVLLRLKELVENDFKVTDADRAKFAEDDARIAEVRAKSGIEGVYPILGDTHYIEYLVGKNAEQSILLTRLQNYIVGDVDVTDEEIVSEYDTQVKAQYEAYRNDSAAYRSAVSGGNTTILYQRDTSYFYVKHILLPFSDEQTADLTAYKAEAKNAGKDYKIMRDTQMVNETVVYPHVNGENDTSNPKTVKQVFDEITAAMARVANSPKEAERLFDEFTYKYNTDTGAFGKGSMYSVLRGDDENHSGYMEEFYDGAIKLSREHKVGEVLPEYVVTDYGVHIMYFAYDPTPGYTRKLGDYLTPGEYKTVRETIAETIKSNKESSAFDSWANERITYYQNNKNYVTKYEKRFKSLYED